MKMLIDQDHLMNDICGDRCGMRFSECEKSKHCIFAQYIMSEANAGHNMKEVVYCSECKHLLPNGKCTMFADDKICPSASDFCSAGERRDEYGRSD